MIRKNLLLTLLMALMVPLAAWAQSALPYTENFNLVQVSQMPEGWTASSTNNNAVGVVDVGASPFLGDHSLGFAVNNLSSSGQAFVGAIMPDYSGGSNLVEMSFQLASRANTNGTFNVRTIKTSLGNTTTNTVATFDAADYRVTSANDPWPWVNLLVVMPNGTGTKNIAFVAQMQSAGVWRMDNLSITDAAPTGLEADAGLDYADISWDERLANQWELRYKKSSETSWTTTTVSQPSIRITGLDPGTEYTVKVRAMISSGLLNIYSGWSEEATFIPGPIAFADANVKALCVSSWDTNNDGELSYAEAAAVTNLGYLFHSNDQITSFDELQYFVGLTSIGNSAFYYCTSLTSVVIPNSVTTIGNSAFYNCIGLTSVVIGNSVTSIGSNAFMGCTHLTSVTIPNSVTTIGNSAFLNCTGLTSVTIGNSVTSIGQSAFNKCSGLTTVGIPNSVISIGNMAFLGCSGLTSVTIGNSVTTIGEKAFEFCARLTSIEIPNSVTTIGNYAFNGCTSLTSITSWPTTPPSLQNENVFLNVSTSIPVTVSCSSKASYQSAPVWSRFTNYVVDTETCPIDFADLTMKALCVANWDTNGDSELSYAEAASVTYLGTVFRNKSNITSFDELQYFIGLTSIGSEAFKGCTGLTSVTIPNSVTTIENSAFYGCTGLTSIEIPNSVTTIGIEAFKGCTGLTSVTIPNSVTTIENSAFYGCTGLTSIEIPNSVTTIGNYAFNNCTSLASIFSWPTTPPSLPNEDVFGNVSTSIPVTVPCSSASYQSAPGWSRFTNYIVDTEVCSIDFADLTMKALCVANWDTNNDGELSYAEAAAVTYLGTVFENKRNITSFDELQYFIGLTSIRSETFKGCTNLAYVTIPNSVITIGSSAFYGCSSLTSVVIPNSVTSIGSSAFYGCSSLTSIEIPNSVTSIEQFAFRGCSSLTSVEIPNSVTTIIHNTFYQCTGLSSVGIPNSVTSIGQYAFYGCSSLTSIEIPNSVNSIDIGAFEGCTSLSSVEIPNSITTIRQGVFRDCTGLVSVEIPNSVTSIGKNAFYGCSSLTSIEVPNSVTSIGIEAFKGCTLLSSVTISNSVSSIGEKVFSGCTGLTSIEIPNSVTTIGEKAFELCAGLTSVTIPNSVTSIKGYAFEGCTSLTSVYYTGDVAQWCGISFTNQYANPLYYGHNLYINNELVTALVIPNSVTSIKSYAFYGCTGLTSVTIPNSVTSIGVRAFYGCTGLTSVTIPNSVTSINVYVFSDCTGLTSVTIPNSVTSIGVRAFYGCTSLTSVTIPNSVTSIGGSAFSGCTSLNSITVLAETPPTLGENAFYNVNKSIPVYVPCGSVAAYQNWGGFTNIVELYCDLPDITVRVNDGSWASTVYAEFEWYHSNITLAEGQSILYDCSMGTVSGEEVTWTDMGSTTAYYIGTPTSGVFKCYLPVGNYTFRTRIRIVEGNTTIATGEWYEIVEPFSIVTANPVNNYPFTFGFEGYAHNFLQGLNLSGTIENVNRFEFGTEATTGIAPHSEGSSYLYFHRNGNNSDYASVVLPMFYNSSTTDLAVSFWLYTNTAPLQGVQLAYSYNGENWFLANSLYCNICENAWNRFVGRIELSGEAPDTPHVYVRLRFVCSETYTEQILCLDDISVQPLSNYKPYITDATSTANSVTLSVIDNAYENGSGSTRFQVGYRISGTDSWTPKAFDNEEPYEQVVQLTVDGLEPNTYYEFRVFSVMPNATGSTTIWSESSNIYSQWTDNTLFIVSPGHPYEFGFETYASGWTVPEGWDTYYEGGYESDHCAHTSTKNEELISPEIGFHENCHNVIIRFWAKGTGQSSPSCLVYSSDDDFATSVRIGNLPNLSADTWTEYVFPLCQFMSSGSVKIAFTWRYFDPNFSIDNIEIVANAYDKVLYKAGNTYNWIAENFCPQGLPDYSDNVLVCTSMFMTQNLGMADNIEFGTFGKLNVLSGKTLAVNNTLTAKHADALHVNGTVIASVLVPQAEGSVEVNDGGVIRAVEIAGDDYTATPNLGINDGGQVYCSNPFFGTYYKNITGYGAENVNQSTGWNLIAPLEAGGAAHMGLVPMNGEEYVVEQMDLYGFNQSADLEWINKKKDYYNHGNDVRYLIVYPKEGYLYARQDDGTLEFKAIAGDNIFRATTQDVKYDELVYDAEAAFAGWNLIGNPYTANAYVKDAEGNAMAYYRMNATGDRIVLAEAGTPIKPCEGVFVQVTDNGSNDIDPVWFTTTQPQRGRGAMDFTVSKQSSTRDGASASATPIDRARISFSEGKGMGHLDLMADANRLYIPQGGKDMAVVCSEPAGEMPLNFEAAENGTYTLGISLNDTELVYCHLIDNMTGADVDLLATSTGSVAEYTFEAKTTDYRSRFKVVFVAKSAFEGDNANNFAFHNGSAWVVNASADATVQVIDMTGRVVLSTDVARNVSTKGMAPGVYVMRLIDGKDVKTQKIVVD